jgi:GDPmannose 4,6-dehydratase
MKTALVIGPLGQDGSFLTDILLENQYNVVGAIRPGTQKDRIIKFKQQTNANLIEVDILNKSAFTNFLQSVNFNEIYNFSGVTDIFNPYDNCLEIINSIVTPTAIILDYIKQHKLIKYFTSSSSLIYDNNIKGPIVEESSKKPRYPYAIGKLAADNLIEEFRDTFKLFCCSGIYFNHDSERRGINFFTRKVSSAVAKIYFGQQNTLELGNINTYKDMGYAREYAHAAHAMLNADTPVSCNIGSGRYIFLQEFVALCFDHVGLNWEEHTTHEFSTHANYGPLANADKIHKSLHWKSTYEVNNLVKIMMDCELKNYAK